MQRTYKMYLYISPRPDTFYLTVYSCPAIVPKVRTLNPAEAMVFKGDKFRSTPSI
jgi:hypothetical protein